MKKHLLIISILLLLAIGVKAQSIKYISQFSHLQQYFNPGLAGYEGSMVRGFVRNQWLGWEGAPKTYFFSAELDFAQLSGEENPELVGKNAISLSLLQDTHGAFTETEVVFAYASRVRLSKSTNLRLGAGITYNPIRLDGTKLTTKQASDPIVSRYLGSFANMSIVDFNLGFALTHANFYLSYGVHNVNGGSLSKGDLFMSGVPISGVFQGGYRNKVSENISISTNLMWRSRADLPENVEFNFKVLFSEKMWLGAGHRVDYANNFQLGFLLSNMRFGYVYEIPMLRSYLLPNPTHEFMLTFSLFKVESDMIW